MNIDFWRIFLVALVILAGMIVWHWVSDAGIAAAGILPSSGNSPRYNLAAGIMCAIGIWGLFRLLRSNPHPRERREETRNMKDQGKGAPA